MPSQCPFRIEPSEEERAVLRKRARSHTGAYWEVVRARIVLLASEEISNKEIAARLDTSPQVVWKWRKRFHEEGVWRGWRIDLVRAGPELFPPE
jgi:Homeodomain-like domain-containing protein